MLEMLHNRETKQVTYAPVSMRNFFADIGGLAWLI